MKNNSVRNVIICIVILLVFPIVYIVVKDIINKEKNDYSEFLKNYEVNEYIPTYVSDEDMARIYLNDYIHTMYQDTNAAYELLNDEYRTKRFGSYENYKNYVYSLNFSSYELNKYYVDKKEGYIYFGVYDKNNNLFIFKTNGVMQYEVYLDDYTVEI